MKHSSSIILLLFFPAFLLCQSIVVTQDFGIWSGLTISKNISKKIDVELEQQVRFYSDATIFDDYYVDLGGKYKLNDNFKLGLNLRYTYNDKRWSDSEHNLRYNVDLNYKIKLLKGLKLYYGFRLQENTIINYQPISLATESMAFRHKLKIKYKLCDHMNIYSSAEIFRYIENLFLPYWGKYRINSGTVLKTKIGDFDLSGGIEQELNTSDPQRFYYLKTMYIISL